MQFCKDCGGVLNLFGNNEKSLCSSCIQHTKKAEPLPVESTPGNHDLLAEAILTCENNKIILRSKEGWELWSSHADSQTELKTILKRANRIYEIRSRRKKK